MAKSRYNVYYTETTLRMINDLEKEGHQQRDVLNAGVVLFNDASDEKRGLAHMIAYNKPKVRFQNALDVIFKSDINSLNPAQAKIAQAIRNQCQGDYGQSEAAGTDIVDGAVDDAASKRLKKDHRTA